MQTVFLSCLCLEGLGRLHMMHNLDGLCASLLMTGSKSLAGRYFLGTAFHTSVHQSGNQTSVLTSPKTLLQESENISVGFLMVPKAGPMQMFPQVRPCTGLMQDVLLRMASKLVCKTLGAVLTWCTGDIPK